MFRRWFIKWFILVSIILLIESFIMWYFLIAMYLSTLVTEALIAVEIVDDYSNNKFVYIAVYHPFYRNMITIHSILCKTLIIPLLSYLIYLFFQDKKSQRRHVRYNYALYNRFLGAHINYFWTDRRFATVLTIIIQGSLCYFFNGVFSV